MPSSSIDIALGFASARADAGKTALVVELAAWFAARGHDVALLDADLGAPDALGRMGIAGSRGEHAGIPCYSLGRALEERGLAALSGELLERELARQLEDDLDFGRRELLLVDLAPGAESSETWLEALGLSALVHVARAGEESALESPLPVLGLIETFSDQTGSRGPRGATLLGRIPFDPALRSRTSPLVLHDARSPAALAVAQAGANLWKRVRSRLSG